MHRPVFGDLETLDMEQRTCISTPPFRLRLESGFGMEFGWYKY